MPIFKSGVTQPVRQAPGRSDRTLAEQAADAILQAIARGAFLPGDPMIEAYIARDLGFSRVPVREALRRLESLGILEGGSPRQPARLIEPTQRDVDELIELRRTLEVMALRHALACQDDPDRWQSMRQGITKGRSAVRTKDQVRMLAADRLFHRGLWEASDNVLLLDSLTQLAQRQLVMWSPVRDSMAFSTAQTEHEAILAAIERRDGGEAERLLSAHVRWLRKGDITEALKAARQKRALTEQVIRR